MILLYINSLFTKLKVCIGSDNNTTIISSFKNAFFNMEDRHGKILLSIQN